MISLYGLKRIRVMAGVGIVVNLGSKLKFSFTFAGNVELTCENCHEFGIQMGFRSRTTLVQLGLRGLHDTVAYARVLFPQGVLFIYVCYLYFM